MAPLRIAILIFHQGRHRLEPGFWLLTPEPPPPAHPFSRMSGSRMSGRTPFAGRQRTASGSVVRRLGSVFWSGPFCQEPLVRSLWSRASSSAG
jgi:hypothetical protein